MTAERKNLLVRSPFLFRLVNVQSNKGQLFRVAASIEFGLPNSLVRGFAPNTPACRIIMFVCRMEGFTKFGLLKNVDGLCDVMVCAEDASKINRIVERFQLATVDTASIKQEIEQARQEKLPESLEAERAMEAATTEEHEPVTKEQEASSPAISEEFLDELLGKPEPPEGVEPENEEPEGEQPVHEGEPLAEAEEPERLPLPRQAESQNQAEPLSPSARLPPRTTRHPTRSVNNRSRRCPYGNCCAKFAKRTALRRSGGKSSSKNGSHDMAEVESLCDRMAILNDGHLVFVGTVAELAAKIGKRYTLHLKTVLGDERFEADNIADTLLTVLEGFKQRGIDVLDIKIDRGTLEQHFIKIAKGNGQ